MLVKHTKYIISTNIPLLIETDVTTNESTPLIFPPDSSPLSGGLSPLPDFFIISLGESLFKDGWLPNPDFGVLGVSGKGGLSDFGSPSFLWVPLSPVSFLESSGVSL